MTSVFVFIRFVVSNSENNDQIICNNGEYGKILLLTNNK